MDLSRIYTKTSRGILDGSLKTRLLGREHGRLLALIDGKSTIGDLLEKNSRLSENRLAAIIDELVAAGFIRLLSANTDADDFGFSSTIIVDEANTQAFFEAQAAAESEMRRAEDQETITKVKERDALLKEVTADIAAEAEVLKRQEAQRQERASAEEAAHRERQAKEAKKSQAEAKARKVEQEAQQRAQSEVQTKARMEAEKKTRQAEKQIKEEQLAAENAKQKAAVAEEKERLAKEKAVIARRELEAKIQLEEEAQRKAEMETRLHQMEQAKNQAQQEVQTLSKALDEARIAAELENRVKRRLEARAREDAETQAKLDAERKTAAEAQARAEEAARRQVQVEAEAKLDAERKARIEAEQKAQAEAEARAKEAARRQAAEDAQRQAVVEAEAKLEAERKARIEAEQKAQAEAEARAKAEAEAQALREAEKIAAAEAQTRAEEEARRQAEAEAEAKLEAEHKARIEAEQKAQAEAEAIAAAEAAVRQEAEAVKRQMEEEQRAEEARRASEAAERELEAERQARALAESTAQALAAEREQMELAAKSREQERLRAREEANAKALAEMEEAKQRAEEDKQREALEEERLREEAQARAVAAAEAATLPFLAQRKRKPMRFDKRWYKSIAMAAGGLLLLAIAVAHVMSFGFYIPKLEQQLTASLGQRVAIQDIHFSAYPAPHLKLDGVTIGDVAPLQIGKADLFPTFASWFSDAKVMRRVELESVSLSQDNIHGLPVWGQNQARAVPLQFEHLRVKNGRLTHPLLDVFTFDADVDVRRGRFIQAQAKSTDQRITINFLPQGDTLRIELNAVKSLLPVEPRLPFDTLKVVALAQAGSMNLSSIDAQLFDGYVSGTARVDWNKGWNFNADLGLKQIAVEPALAQFTKEMKLSGTLEAKVRLAAHAETLETLFAIPQIQATFRVKNGEFSGIDLVRSIQAQRHEGDVAGKTNFTDLSGYFQFVKGAYQYRQIKLQGGVVSAGGNLEISPEKNLSGNLLAELHTRSAKQRMPFIFTGNMGAPSLKLAPRAQRAERAPAAPSEEAQ